jgi:hypothetical protein
MGRLYTVGIDEPDPHDPETNGVDPDFAHDREGSD